MSDDNNNNHFIIVSITSSSLESPLLKADTYRELSKNNTQKSRIREVKIKSCKDDIHLGSCLDLASVRGSKTAWDLSPIFLYSLVCSIVLGQDIP